MIASGSLLNVNPAMTRMTLADLLDPEHVRHVVGDPTVEIRDLCANSRDAREGSLFFAVRGVREDGAKYVPDAVRRGAVAAVVPLDFEGDPGIPILKVADVRAAKSEIASRFFGEPSHAMRVVGVTGTNGKTTTAAMIRAILDYDRGPSVSIGTLGVEIGAHRIQSAHTTPDAIDVQRYLSRGRRMGCRSAVMEVSSHALDQRRVEHVHFSAAVFTNLSRDHLDYHGDMRAYLAAKKKLFEGLDEHAVAVLNDDDLASASLRDGIRARVVTYGLSPRADHRASVRRVDIDGVSFVLHTETGDVYVHIRLVGRHNLMNAVAASSACMALGLPPESVRGGLSALRRIPGRLEPVDCGQDFRVLVDYAHTDDALARVLDSLRSLTRGRLITVFGCGGDRDPGKRPRMGAVAAQRSDKVILTSDNPRDEDPGDILRQIVRGMPAGTDFRIEPDRRAAIEMALRIARGGDIVLIAGKGHETEQIAGGNRIPFDDRAVAREVLWSL